MTQLDVGQVLEGRYRIDTPIARGGMSTVYRCVDLRLGRSVAAKVMDERFSGDPVFRNRFRREARSMAMLSDPCLVNVYDTSADGGHVFLIMELITGGTLRELLAERGPMPPHAATSVMRSVLTGLSVAHTAGMVHRDIKPDNILINSDGQVKLADFGLVRAAAASPATGDTIIGTASYLSPEQVENTGIGPASDVYSAGVVLFELLTGRTPFTGENDTTRAYARLTEDVPPPSAWINGVPNLFDELVATATAREPADRFADAGEFLEALEDVATELRLAAFRVPAPTNSAAHRATGFIDTPTDMFTSAIEKPGGPDASVPTTPPGAGTDTTQLGDGDPAAGETRVLQAVDGGTGTDDTALLPPQEAPAQVWPTPPTEPEHEAAHHDPHPGYRAEPHFRPPVTSGSGLGLIIWLTVVAVVTVAIAVGAWWYGSGRYGEVPQVLGMDPATATATVTEAGFEPVSRSVYDDDVPFDRVVGTDPPGSRRVPRGEPVSVLVSLGSPTVPALPTDRDPGRFRAALSQRTLDWVDGDSVYSDDVPAGGVARTDPPSGKTVQVGGSVTVHLSKGPAPVEVPKVSGMSGDEARTALERAGFTVSGTDERFDPEVDAGDAVATTPAAGTTLARGSDVTLIVSNALTVPDVVGLSEYDALNELSDAGLAAGEITRTDLVGATAHAVMDVSPKPGDRVDPANPEVNLLVAEKVNVPFLIGKRADEARRLLADAGLTHTGLDGTSDGARVVTQSPAGNRDIDPGTTVKVRTVG
ncbi:Stk1 family PASTA domain-containing Ser/Thr kinase [Corynebacterium pygosceleis]|uniref:non-specific serine/threonine protein kinase n=1 Tax=Corynebacterium pygosceleis TaxID=2800406 RepID=A0A9Q4C8F2_9CORY|nr:Stk1 family PASTA domain-containing Ser/Thr kinase [Corynebacterium pygosceleis]MCK7636632.1 Stk1 family PASTA domain-containing Ser/Thr kinase [Corynebacterium pygosceleis]MCK7675206.1 Stk1 family PASTA domain-containing Ser/Thr kinase [Corynebacterium pygosceleis]MCX7467385.1 Stk1 family PASTA domain-containing Ser/Thr kinase [Corynebacterium pygosceleis]